MTDIDISPAAVARMLDGVTEGPMRSKIVWAGDDARICFMTGDGQCRQNAAFIAYSRSAVPALAAERDAAVKRAEQAVASAYHLAHAIAGGEDFAGLLDAADTEQLVEMAAKLRAERDDAEDGEAWFRHRLHAMHRRAQRAEAVKGKALAKALAEVRAVALREALEKCEGYGATGEMIAEEIGALKGGAE